jgi:undecaprenyl-diphosphatase
MTRRGAVLVAVTALVGVVLCAAVASSGTVGSIEAAVFDAINGLPDWLERPMWVMQLFGLLLTPLVFAAVAAAYRKWRLAIALALVPVAKLIVEKGIVKPLVERQRPGVTEVDPVLRDVPTAGNSFPSGHAMIVGAIAMLLWPHLNRAGRVITAVVVVLTLIGRVYLGAHNPLDVVAGVLIGVLIGLALGLLTGDVRLAPRRHPSPDDRPSAATTAD